MYELLKRLFPICRSLTGDGVRKTLRILSEEIPLTINEVPTGTKAFDWEIPKEWNIKGAYIEDEQGERIIDFKDSNLHVMGYSISVDKVVPLEELQQHLYSLEDLPDAIPYITSYYRENWGFCIEHKKRKKLKKGNYHVVIDSSLKNGSLTYGECIIPGKSKKEVFLSTYICHPSMANNELSGPVVITTLAKWLASEPREYTYRIIYVPETIGAITYLSRNLSEMKRNIIAGFNVTCVGDDGPYSYLPSRNGQTYADKVVLNTLRNRHPDFLSYSFLDRGSDERQYCSPGVDLPVVTIMRSKYGTYPEYHTSHDNLEFVSAAGLEGSLNIYKDCITTIEKNRIYNMTCLCEPQLGPHGLYPLISGKDSFRKTKAMRNFIAYADGINDLIDISNTIDVPIWELLPIIEKLIKTGLLIQIEE
jgi:aminopeptidase-like protein